MATSIAIAMLAKLSVNCLPTPAWPIVTFLPDHVLPSEAMALDTLPVTAPAPAELLIPAVTSPMFCWLWRAMLIGPYPALTVAIWPSATGGVPMASALIPAIVLPALG